jgi:type IV pilus assembly protein PilV
MIAVRHVHMARRAARLQTGFSMIEVLVSILVASFGILGILGMQLMSVQTAHSSQQRSVAALLAMNMMDRMRANMAGVAVTAQGAGGGYDRPVTGNVYGSGGPYMQQKSNCVGYTGAVTAQCTATDIADNDAYDWQRLVAQRLANGVGIVCKDTSGAAGSYNGTTVSPACNGNGSAWVIKIYWMDDRTNGNAAGNYYSYTVSFIP